MQAKDIMTIRVVTVGPDATVREIAAELLDKRISAVPVVDDKGAVLGIVSEGDLLRRQEIGTDVRHRSWWLSLFEDAAEMAAEYAKTHGVKARDVMTKDVVTVSDTASLGEVAEILMTRHIKRVPVMRDGKLAGIVSRANLLQALAAQPDKGLQPVSASDEEIRAKVVAALEAEPWGNTWNTNVLVAKGVVEFWGTVDSDAEREASRIVAENIAGVVEVKDRRGAQRSPASGL